MGQEQSSEFEKIERTQTSNSLLKKFQSTPQLFESQEAKDRKQQLIDEKLGRLSISTQVPIEEVLGQDFEKILDELSVPQDKRDHIRNLPKDKKYMLLKQHQTSLDLQRPSTPEAVNTIGTLKSAGHYIQALALKQVVLSHKELLKELLSLEVALRSLPLSWVAEFIQNDGLDVLLRNFRQLCLQAKLDNEEREIQNQYIRCFRTIMNNAIGLTAVMNYPNGVSIITLGYDNKSLKMKSKLLEILGAVCLVIPNGHGLVVEAFTEYQRYKNESFRFQTLVSDLNQDDNDFQVVCMALITAIVNSPDEQEYRQVLRYEFLNLNIADILSSLKEEEPSNELMKHIKVFEEEAEADFADMMEEVDIGEVDSNDPDDIYATIKAFISDPDSYSWMLKSFQKLLQVNTLDPKRRAKYWQTVDTLLEEVILQKNNIKLNYHKFNFRVDKLIKGFASEDDFIASKEECEELKKQLTTFSKDINEIREILVQKEGTIEELSNSLKTEKEKAAKADAELKGMMHKFDLQSKSIQELKQEKGVIRKGSDIKFDVDNLPPELNLNNETKLLLQEYLNGKLSYNAPPSTIPKPENVIPRKLTEGKTEDDILNSYSESETVVSPGSVPPAPPLPTPGVSGDQNARKRIQTCPSIKMRQMQWSKIPDSQLSHTVWNGMDKDDSIEKTLDYEDLEQTFGISDKPKSNFYLSNLLEKEKKGDAKPVVKMISLLDVKKAYNISIMLSRVKFTFTEIRVAILQMAEEKLSENFVKQLMNYIPTNEEQVILTENLDSYDQLGKPEQFYIEIMKISRYEQRLLALNLKRKLPERIDELRPNVMILLNASKEVVNSPKLRKLLEVILIIGNFMNSSSFRGNAFGYKIDTLTKLNDIRGNQKGTFMHYLNYLIDKKFPELRTISSELVNVERASKLSIVAIAQEFKDLKALLLSVIDELPRHKNPDNENDKYYSVMKSFLDIYQPLFTKLEVEKQEMEIYFSKALEFFGEDDKVTSEQFFAIFSHFVISFERSYKENVLEEEMAKKAEEHSKFERKILGERHQKQQKLLESTRRGVIDELVSSLKTGNFISQAAEERRKNKRISKAIERSDLDAEKLLQELRETYEK